MQNGDTEFVSPVRNGRRDYWACSSRDISAYMQHPQLGAISQPQLGAASQQLDLRLRSLLKKAFSLPPWR